MAEDRVIVHIGGENDQDSYRTFRIDDHGIKREGYRLLPWSEVQCVRAWVTAGDGDWGYDEFHSMELTYTDGYHLRVTNASGGNGEMLLYSLQECIRWFLPTIDPDWRAQVWADYQRHYRRQHWLSSMGVFVWRWYPGKPVIYERPPGGR